MSPHSIDTSRIDPNNPKANTYGVLPCPKCGSAFRETFKAGRRPMWIQCSDCGFKEFVSNTEYFAWEGRRVNG